MKEIIIIFLFGFFLSCVDKKSATDNLNLSIEEINKKEYKDALVFIKLAFNKDSSNSSILYYKGLIETNLKNTSEALISFQKAISFDSTNYKALVERAKLKITLGDIVSALNDCDKARLLKKDYTELYLTKANAYEKMNDNSNAIIQYECAIKYGNKTGETYFKIGLLNLNAGKKDVACVYLRIAGDLGFMESFELIKANCNSEDEIKTNKNKESFSETEDGKVPSIKIDDVFNDWEKDFTFKGISSESGLHRYSYNLKITTLICDHKVDKLIVSTRNNNVVSYMYLLLPNMEDTGVPGCLIKKLQKQVGAQMSYKNGKYVASDGKIIVGLHREDNPTFGGDRIFIYTSKTE